MARLDDATDASLWTPDELEELLVRSAPPVTPDGFVQTDGATTTSASSPSSLPSDDAAVKVADGELDAAARRTRRTEIERLSRRRRQAALRGMRDEVRTLEAEFAGIMNDHAMRYRNTKAPTTLLLDGAPTPIEDDGSEDLKLRDQTIRHLREQFIELKLHEGELEKEKKELHRSLRNKQLLALSIQSLGFSSVRTWTDPEHSLPPASEPAFMLPLADEYTRLMRGAYDELVALEATTAFESLGSSCMGWSGRRAVNDTSLVFSLSKTFAGRDAAPILLESWDVFSSEARLRESFGAWGVHVQLRVLDRPHDDILVIHRSNIRRGCKKSGERRHHVVFLLFRVRTPDGFTLCMRSMPSLQTDLPPPEHWTGIFTWIHFRESLQPDGTNDCEVVYNNYMPYRRRRPVSDAFVAFLSTVVRWESACVASLLLTVA